MNEQNTGSEIPDPYFSRIRAIDCPPDAVVTRQIRDALAQVDERNQNPVAKTLAIVAGLGPIGAWGVVVLERQVIGLRKDIEDLCRQLRELRGD